MTNLVPNWNNIKYQNQLVEGEESKRSSHVLMDNREVTELTWENGQLAIHGLSGLLPNKPTWGRASDTLESMVHHATSIHNNYNPEPLLPHHCYQLDPPNASSTVSFPIETPEFTHVESRPVYKRMRSSEPDDQRRVSFDNNFHEERGSACAGGSATFSRENDATTMMTWNSLEEDPPSLKVKTRDGDSACHDGSENKDQDQEQRETKGETSRPKTTRPNRAAANHNQSERRRRDRINQKMKALQRLVPNASKSDKASMLDEVIEYLKQLQSQVKMLNTRSLPQMMMPALEMQQHMQMSLLARMGMGVGLGIGPVGHAATQSLPPIINPTQIASAASSQFFSSPFMMPQMMTNHSPNGPAINNSAPINNPYFPYFAQPMNMDLYNKMATLYQQQQQINQTNQPTCNSLPNDNNVQRR